MDVVGGVPGRASSFGPVTAGERPRRLGRSDPSSAPAVDAPAGARDRRCCHSTLAVQRGAAGVRRTVSDLPPAPVRPAPINRPATAGAVAQALQPGFEVQGEVSR